MVGYTDPGVLGLFSIYLVEIGTNLIQRWRYKTCQIKLNVQNIANASGKQGKKHKINDPALTTIFPPSLSSPPCQSISDKRHEFE